MSAETTIDERTFCAVHPDRETTLRCNKCERYMCVKCAVQTPVGYRCRECVRGQERQFFRANVSDNWIMAGVCAVLTGLAAALIGATGFGLFIAIVLGFPIGGGISEIALRAVGKRRGLNFDWFGAAGAIVGGLIGLLIQYYFWLQSILAPLAAEFGGELPDELLAQFTLDPATVLTTRFDVLIFIGIVAVAIFLRFRVKRAA